ncbi:lipopolysaccharide biosynthesis protein [Microbacterium suwonense]|uniref:Polysaccharide biosynthesis protein C-terminal domain-containing protein n=1 Tax=Microbacterium suwonense TaxID=683047 RepID=A0ABN6X3U5_9MICO|nr:oligosaccharide flippase family protein [Microbacterium suwonense]BDZ39222.1 hypothetical protein GCM10025863_18360 [Microbacterium suwonense]
MRREAFGAILWNFFGLFCSLLNGILTARLLSPGDRGVLALAITISSMSYVLSSVGTNAAVRTFQPRAEWASFRTYASVSLRLVGLNCVAVVGALVLFCFSGAIPVGFAVCAVIMLLGIANFASSQLLDVLNAIGKTSRSAAVNTSGHAITAVVLLVAFFLHVDNVAVAIGAYLVGFVGRTTISLLLIRLDRGFHSGALAVDHGRLLLRHGLRFWGMSLGQALAFRLDLLLLGVLVSSHTVGIYAVAVTPAALTQVVSNSLGQVVYREAAVRKLGVRRLALWSLAALGMTALYALVLAIAAPWLMPLVFGAEYEASVPIVRVLLLGELALAPYLVISRGLAGYNYPWWASISGIVGSVAMVGAVFILTPGFGVIGAAFGVSIAYSAMLLVAVSGLLRRGIGRRRSLANGSASTVQL